MDPARNSTRFGATNASRALTAVQFRLATVSLQLVQIKYLLPSTKYQELSTWYQVPSTWYQVPSTSKDAVASLNWTAVRALEAFVPPKRVEFRGASNGNTPRPTKFINKIENGSKSPKNQKHLVLPYFYIWRTPDI